MWVFGANRSLSWCALMKELAEFSGSRVLTGICDVALIWLTVDLLQWNEVMMKIGVGVLIVVLNYVISRWWVFRAQKEAV